MLLVFQNLRWNSNKNDPGKNVANELKLSEMRNKFTLLLFDHDPI